MSDQNTDLLDEGDPRRRQSATELRSDLASHIDAIWESIEAMLAVAESDGGPMLAAANRVADEVGNLKMVLQESDAANRRRHTRVFLDMKAKCETGAGSQDCVIANMSVSGAALSPRIESEPGDIFKINLNEIGDIACEVVSLSDSLTHVRFGETDGRIQKALGNLLQERLTPSDQ